MTKRVLAVGNCSFDNHNLKLLISANFDAELTPASLADEAFDMLGTDRYDLVLVNRKLESDASDGLELVKRIKADPQRGDTPVMLVSNFPDAQKRAAEAGAEPGFGKAELELPETVEKLALFLGS